MKKACKNCVWIHSRRIIFQRTRYFCIHNSLDEEKEIDIYETNINKTTPKWCPGFFPKPEPMPKEMADKIFRSDDDEDI